MAVGWILSPIDAAVVCDGEEPLRAAEQLPYAHVSSFHVVIVPGVPLVSGAVHDSGQLFRGAVTQDHMQTAKQENCVQVQSWEQLLKVPCQHPFVHYHTMQWESMDNILNKKICALFFGPTKPLSSSLVISRSPLFLQHRSSVGRWGGAAMEDLLAN